MEIGISTWAGWKALCITTKNLNNQYVDLGSAYRLVGPDANNINWILELPKKLENGDTNPDVTTFETDYKSSFNWAIGSRAYPFATGDFDFQRKGMFNTVNASEYDMFMKVWDDHLYLNGGTLYCGTGFTFGDWAEMAIVDHDNLLGYGVDFVLKTWILSSYPDPTGKCEIMTPYAGNPPKNFYIRVKYHRIGEANVPVAVNLNFHKAI